MKTARLLMAILSLFAASTSSLADIGNHPPPKTVTIQGTTYKVFYHWTNPAHGDHLIGYGGYNSKLHQANLDYAAALEKAGGTGNFNDPGLNVSTNTHDAAWFAGRAGAGPGQVTPGAKLLEVLVPEKMISKAHYNEMAGRWTNLGWYTLEEAVDGSIIQEFKGTGLSQQELLETYDKVANDHDVQKTLESINKKRVAQGMKPLKEAPSVNYLKSRLPEVLDEKNVPKDHPLRASYKKSASGATAKASTPKGGKISAKSAAQKTSSPTKVASGSHCATCPRETMSQNQKAIKTTMGSAGNLFSMVGGVVQTFIPASNPFAGEPTAVDCDVANRLKGKVTCYWDSPLNPINDIAYCYTVTKVRPLEEKNFSLTELKDKPACEIGFRFGGLRADSPAAKEYLEKKNYFDPNGVPFTDGSMEEFLRTIKKAVPITDEVFKEHRRIPEPKPPLGFGDGYAWTGKITTSEV